MNGKGVQKRLRAVKFSRTPKPISPCDHDGTFVGAPPQRVDPKVRCMHRELSAISVRAGAGRARGAVIVSPGGRWESTPYPGRMTTHRWTSWAHRPLARADGAVSSAAR